MTQLLTTNEAAKRLGVSLRTVQRLLTEGELPIVRVGRLVRVPDDKLDKWIEAHTEMPTDMQWRRRAG